MKVFISGPMSGYEDYNRAAFMAAEKLLKEAGFDVFNPAWMDVGAEWTSKELLSIDICALSHCDAIYHLNGWKNSSGAKLEDDYSLKANIPQLIFCIVDTSCTLKDIMRWNDDSTLCVPYGTTRDDIREQIKSSGLECHILNEIDEMGEPIIFNWDEPIDRGCKILCYGRFCMDSTCMMTEILKMKGDDED